ENIFDRAVQNAAVVQAVSTAQDGFAVTEHIISEPKARSEIVLVARAVRHSREGRVASARRSKLTLRVGQLLVVVAHAYLDRHAWAQLPVVLHEETVVHGGDVEQRIAVTLEVAGVARQGTDRGAYLSGGRAIACRLRRYR